MVNWPRLALRALGKRLPTVDGTLQVRGVGGRVEIRRDRFGIPHITAGDDADAWFAVGFCHGQDRAFQIETRLRLVRGTLAALIGPAGLPLDRLSRRIGFRRYGEEAAAALSPEHRRLAEAYARGVTAGADAGLRAQAPRVRPAPGPPHPLPGGRRPRLPRPAGLRPGLQLGRGTGPPAGPDPRRAGSPARPRPRLPGMAAGLATAPARRRGRPPTGWPRTPPAWPRPWAWAGPRTTGRSPGRAPAPGARCWPTTPTCPPCSPRTGTCCTSPRPSGRWPGPPSPGPPPWPPATTGIPPGG